MLWHCDGLHEQQVISLFPLSPSPLLSSPLLPPYSEGDPMRLLFERDLTPHPQYASFYKWLSNTQQPDCLIHFGELYSIFLHSSLLTCLPSFPLYYSTFFYPCPPSLSYYLSSPLHASSSLISLSLLSSALFLLQSQLHATHLHSSSRSL